MKITKNKLISIKTEKNNILRCGIDCIFNFPTSSIKVDFSKNFCVLYQKYIEKEKPNEHFNEIRLPECIKEFK